MEDSDQHESSEGTLVLSACCVVVGGLLSSAAGNDSVMQNWGAFGSAALATCVGGITMRDGLATVGAILDRREPNLRRAR